MKFKFNYLYLILAAIIFSGSQNHQSFKKDLDISNQEFQKNQVPFISNKGQLYPDVNFYRSTPDECFYLTKKNEMIYSVPAINNNLNTRIILNEKMKASLFPMLRGKNRSKSKVNYFRGSDRSHWTRNVPVFDVVEIDDLYKEISRELRTGSKTDENVFYIEPWTDPGNISIEIKGGDE